MKIIARIFAILAAAMLIVGIALAITPAGRAPRSGGPAQGGFDRGRNSGFNARGVSGVIQHLIVIGGVVLVVTLGSRFTQPRRPLSSAA